MQWSFSCHDHTIYFNFPRLNGLWGISLKNLVSKTNHILVVLFHIILGTKSCMYFLSISILLQRAPIQHNLYPKDRMLPQAFKVENNVFRACTSRIWRRSNTLCAFSREPHFTFVTVNSTSMLPLSTSNKTLCSKSLGEKPCLYVNKQRRV